MSKKATAEKKSQGEFVRLDNLLTDNDELDRHKEPKEVEKDLERWPARSLPETISARS